MNSENINEIGKWALRLLLAGGAIFAAFKGNTEVAGSLLAALIMSFILL